nr:very short patch repair endonuclease [Burkholderia vietnamiensis]
MDTVDPATRSRMMAGIRSTNTRPELTVRKFLHAQGFRFRLHHGALPGRPDIVLPKWRTAIFVHGCFWHRHPGCDKATTPSTNVEKWRAKFSDNVARDRKVRDALVNNGWKVIVIWECGIGRKSDTASLEWLPDAITKPRTQVVEWPSQQSGKTPGIDGK